MERIISFILFLAFQISFAQAIKQEQKCPPPRFKQGQTPAQVREDTRIYVECVAEYNARRNAERTAPNASNTNQQRRDAQKEAQQRRREERQREARERREANRRERERQREEHKEKEKQRNEQPVNRRIQN